MELPAVARILKDRVADILESHGWVMYHRFVKSGKFDDKMKPFSVGSVMRGLINGLDRELDMILTLMGGVRDPQHAKSSSIEDPYVEIAVRKWLEDYWWYLKSGGSERAKQIVEYRTLAVVAEILSRMVAFSPNGATLIGGRATRIVDKIKAGSIPEEYGREPLYELISFYVDCAFIYDCTDTAEDVQTTRKRLVDTLIGGAEARREVLDELTRSGKNAGIKPSDDFFVDLFVAYTRLLQRIRQTQNPDDAKAYFRDALVGVMRKHLLKAVHLPTGLTVEEYLSKKQVDKAELEKTLEKTINAVADRIASTTVDSIVKEKDMALRIILDPVVLVADVAYLEQLIHIYAFYGDPSDLTISLGKYLSYRPVPPEKPDTTALSKIELSSILYYGENGRILGIKFNDDFKKELRKLYLQLVDPYPGEQVESKDYYDSLLKVVDYFYRKFPELNEFMAKLASSPILTGETSATVQVGDKLVSVSYEYTAVDFLEFVTIRSLVRDREAREKLVDELISMMERLHVEDNEKAVTVRQYVESKGVSWDVFKETLRKGLSESIEGYAEFLSKGSGSELAKHIYFRESAKKHGSFFDYWIVRLSREFGILMFEYYAEVKLLDKLKDMDNTTKYLRSSLKLKASLKDLAHKHSELLRSSGQSIEGFSFWDRLRARFGGKHYTKVLQTRDRFEQEKAGAVLRNLQAESAHRFELEAPALLPDLVYDGLKKVEKNIVDEMVEEARRRGREKKDVVSDLVTA